MTTRDNALQHLLSAINHFAPTAKDQKAASRIVTTMQKANESDEIVARTLCSFLYDGLTYNNWPSTLARKQY